MHYIPVEGKVVIIPRKVMSDKSERQEVTTTRKEILDSIIARPSNPQTGMLLKEQRMANKLLDKLESANGTLAVEDAEWEYLKEKVESNPWAVASRDIEAFCDAVLNAPTEPPSPNSAVVFKDGTSPDVIAAFREEAAKAGLKLSDAV